MHSISRRKSVWGENIFFIYFKHISQELKFVSIISNSCHQHHHHHHFDEDSRDERYRHNIDEYIKSSKYSEEKPTASVENHIHPVVLKENYSENHFRKPKPKLRPYSEEDEDDDEDFYIIKKRKSKFRRKKKQRKYHEEDVNREYKPKKRNRFLARDFNSESNDSDYGGSEEMEVYLPSIQRNDYDGGYLSDTVNLTRAVVQIPPKQRRLYTKWSKWSKCTPKCTTRRFK